MLAASLDTHLPRPGRDFTQSQAAMVHICRAMDVGKVLLPTEAVH